MHVLLQVEELRGAPLNVANLEEIIDEKCAPLPSVQVRGLNVKTMHVEAFDASVRKHLAHRFGHECRYYALKAVRSRVVLSTVVLHQ